MFRLFAGFSGIPVLPPPAPATSGLGEEESKSFAEETAAVAAGAAFSVDTIKNCPHVHTVGAPSEVRAVCGPPSSYVAAAAVTFTGVFPVWGVRWRCRERCATLALHAGTAYTRLGRLAARDLPSRAVLSFVAPSQLLCLRASIIACA